MSSENSVCLIKNFPFNIPTQGDGIPVRLANAIMSRPPTSSHVSAQIDAISEFLKTNLNNGNTMLVRLSATKTSEEKYAFGASASLDGLDHLRSILDSPYLQIECKVKIPSTTSFESVKLQNRVDLRLVGKHSRDSKQYHFSGMPASTGLFTQSVRPGEPKPQQLFTASDSMDNDCTFDISIGWTVPSEKFQVNTVSLMRTLFESDASKDLTIVAGNGAEVKCHKIIFEAQNDILATMVSTGNGMKESQTGRIELPENSEEGLTLLVRSFYGMDLTSNDFSSDVAVELFKISEKYKLTELQGYLVKILLKKGSSWFAADDLLELYFYLKNLGSFQDLMEYLLWVMLSFLDEIRGCERFQDVRGADPKAARQLMWTLLNFQEIFFRSK